MLREALGVDRRRGDDELQILAFLQQALQVTEQEVDVEAALVRLVNDDRVVGLEQRVMLRLSQQYTVRHQLDQRIRRRAILEADFDTDAFANAGIQLFGNAPSHRTGGQTTGLRVTNQPLHAPTQFQTDLRQLRRFTRAGFSADDDHGVRGNRCCDLVLAATDGQRLGKNDLTRHLRQTLFARRNSGTGFAVNGRCCSGRGLRGWHTLHSRYFSGRAAIYQVKLRFHRLSVILS